MKTVRSPWSSHRADSVPEEQSQTASRHSEEPQMMRSVEADPEPPPTDAEGEQSMQALPPISEEPRAAADSEYDTPPLGRVDPRFVEQFEQLMGMKIFRPNVPGASTGVTGPGDE
jgi:hypothetical protein